MVTARRLRGLMGLLLVWLAVAATPAWAQRARLHVDTDQLVVGQTVSLVLILEGAEPAGVPAIPNARGVDIRYRQMTTTMSLINGVGGRAVQLGYDLTATEKGTWTLGPVGVSLKGARTITAPPITVEVAAAPAVHAGGEAPLQVFSGFVHPPRDTGDTDEADAGPTEQRTAWQGEVVVWKEELRTRVAVESHRWHGRPEAGLLAPQDGQPRERSWTLRDRLGAVQHAVRWWPFLVTEPGRRTYDPMAVEIEVATDDPASPGLLGFFRRTRREVRRTDAVTLDVRPLPPAPSGYSGLVGDFTLKAALERDTAKVGQGISWEVELSGDGTLEGATLPPLGDLEGARVYDSSPRVSGGIDDGAWRARARFVREIVPTREGTVQLPDLEILVFSPDAGEYVTLRAPGGTLTVLPGEAGEAEITSFASAPEGTDTPPDARDGTPRFRVWAPGVIVPFSAWMPVAWLLALLPGLAAGVGASRDALHAWSQRRADAVASRPRTIGERIADLPDDPASRWAALEALLREVAPSDHHDADRLLSELTRVRFAGAVPADDLATRTIAMIRRLGGRR